MSGGKGHKTVPELIVAAKTAAFAQDFGRARVFIAQAIEDDPNNAELYAYMGWYVHRANTSNPTERDRLTAHFMDTALQLGPQLPLVHFQLGRLNLNKGNENAARACFRKATQIDGGYAPAKEALAALDKVEEKDTKQRVFVPIMVPHLARRRKATRGSLGLIGAFCLAFGYHCSSDVPQERGELEEELDTIFDVDDIFHGQTEIRIAMRDQGWKKYNARERLDELLRLREKLPGLGVKRIIIIGNSRRLAEITPTNVCQEESCGDDF